VLRESLEILQSRHSSSSEGTHVLQTKSYWQENVQYVTVYLLQKRGSNNFMLQSLFDIKLFLWEFPLYNFWYGNKRHIHITKLEQNRTRIENFGKLTLT
jgi:hypothetical protein